MIFHHTLGVGADFAFCVALYIGALKTDRGWDGFDYVSIDSMM